MAQEEEEEAHVGGEVLLSAGNHGESLWRKVPTQLSAGKYIFTFGSILCMCSLSNQKKGCVTLYILKLYPFTSELFKSRLLYGALQEIDACHVHPIHYQDYAISCLGLRIFFVLQCAENL